MAINVRMSEENLKNNGKVYAVAFFSFIFLFILIFTTGQKIYGNINKTINDTKQIESDVKLLQSKIESLKTVNKGFSSSDVDMLSISFPEENPSLFMYSQLKELAKNNNIILENISFSPGSPLNESVLKSAIDFTISGTKESVDKFILELSDTAPLSGLGGMSFDKYVKEGETFKINMSVDIFYSPLPKTLPSQTNIVQYLTDDEKKSLNSLIGLKILTTLVSKPMPANEINIDPFTGGVATESGTHD